MEEALRKLEELLPGANYIVDFQVVQISALPLRSPAQYIIEAVGSERPLTRVAAIGLAEVLAEVEHYLSYDRNQYRDLERRPQETPRFAQLVAVVRAELERLASDSQAIFRFWRHDPIEWQFSFLFVGLSVAVAFIGWGSD